MNQLVSYEEAVTVTKISNQINVTVFPEYLENHSFPEKNSYAFSYTVTIENLGLTPVQLLSRHWYINSGGGEYMEVKGEGVVGEKPHIMANQGYRYSSGAMIKDPVGQMHGKYTFKSLDGDSFDVEIPTFDLIYPHLLH